jgi:hypothetical protein
VPSTVSDAVIPTYSGTPSGACGKAQGAETLTAPKVNLCSSGISSAVVANAGRYSWTCATGSGQLAASCNAPGATVKGAIGTTTFELQKPSGCIIEKVGLTQPSVNKPKGVRLPYGLVNFALNNCKSIPVMRLTHSGKVNNMSLWESIHQTWQSIPNASLIGNTVLYSIKDNGSYDSNPKARRITGTSGPGTRNLKHPQTAFVLSSNKTEMLSGRSATLYVKGGKGIGKINYIAKSTGGSSCKVVSAGSYVLLKTSGINNGTCSVLAIKEGDSYYSVASSNLITINVICPKN